MITALALSALLLADTTGPRAAQRLPDQQAAGATFANDPWLGEDKFKHFAFSYAITTTTAAAVRLVADRDAGVAAGAALGVLAGIAKELYDRKTNNTASVRDLLWDLAGVGAGVLLMQQVR